MTRALVTGGAGFIGSALVRYLVEATEHDVLTIDKLTYAGNLDSLASISDRPNHRFLQLDITDAREIGNALADFQPDVIYHLAAESHVDRSIDGPRTFIETNVVGTFVLLNEALAYYRSLAPERQQRFRFLHVSTDEVFGSLGADGMFTEETPYDPSSPYSASKAASDHLARAWHRTYGLPVLVSNCSNNYGPYQFPEKLIPHMIVRALGGQPLPVYGSGANVRDWLHVEDHVRALHTIATAGRPGETYLISGRGERRNLDVVHALCDALDRARPLGNGDSYRSLITFVQDRPGHDFRYAIDATKLERELGWTPSVPFDEGLQTTVDWYLTEETWWRRILSGAYRADRLGLEEEK